jgi:hypothetical protein
VINEVVFVVEDGVDDDMDPFKLHQAASSDARPRHMPVVVPGALLQG